MFNLKDILVQENMDLSRPIYEYNAAEPSYFEMGLSAISECKADFRNDTIAFYSLLSESDGSEESINEAFTDFFSKVAELIKKFLKLIQRIFDKFIAKFNALIKSEKYLVKHKDAFKRFTSDHEFEYRGYTYTFDSSIPITTSSFNESAEGYKFTKLASDFMGADKSKSLYNRLEDYKNKLIDYSTGEFQDRYRGYVIGKPPIDSSDFGEELFAVYRNGDTDSYEFTVDRSIVDKCLETLTKYTDNLNTVKKTKERLEREYKEIEKTIRSYAKGFKATDYLNFLNDYIDSNVKDTDVETLPENAVAIIDLILKRKADNVVSEMEIHTEAFTAKMDAMKECYNQSRNILYKAIYKLGIREAALPITLDDTGEEDQFSLNIGEPDMGDDSVELDDVEFTESGFIVYGNGNKLRVSDDEYSYMDLFHPSEELYESYVEAGILQVVSGEEDAFSFESLPLPEELMISNDDLPNDMNISYDIFLATEYCNDLCSHQDIQEIALRSSGEYTTEMMELIHENVVDAIKSGWRRIWNAIVKVWNKFVQTMDELFKKDENYLKKYQDIILKRKVLFESIDAYQYFDEGHGVKIAISEPFSGNDFTTKNISSTEQVNIIREMNDFLQRKIGADNKTIDDKEQFQDAILEVLQGTETRYEKQVVEANMKNMYDFCMNYKEYKDSTKKLLDNIEKSIDKMEKEIQDMASKLPNDTKKSADNTQKNEESPKTETPSKQPQDNVNNNGNTEGTDTPKDPSNVNKQQIKTMKNY